MAVHYLEIVTNEPDVAIELYERVHDLSFDPPDAELGHAQVATQADGGLVGVRRPLAAHEQPTLRAYLPVEDIEDAVQEASAAGGVVAYPPTRQGPHGIFAIVIHGDQEHGLWQRA